MPASGRACPSTPALAVTQTAVTLSRAVEMQRPSDLGRSSSCWIEPRDGIRGEPIGAVLRGDAWQVVLVAAWILDRFHVRDDLGVFELDDETLFEVFDEVVACWIVSRRLQHVHGDVAGMAGDAGPDGVNADVVGVEVVQDCLESVVLLGGEGPVHEPVDRPGDEVPAGPDDVAPQQLRDDGVELEPAGQGHQQDAQHDSGRGPQVGHQVFAVSVESANFPSRIAMS